jgi:hypothetical protein
MTWISVKDRQPKVGELVRWKGERWRYHQNLGEDIVEDMLAMPCTGPDYSPILEYETDQDQSYFMATHWQPLPEPPVTEQEAGDG